jgi:hypothetical protein
MPDMRMLNRQGERPLANVFPDGRLKNTSTLHGRYYKAAPATASLLREIARAPSIKKSNPLTQVRSLPLTIVSPD